MLLADKCYLFAKICFDAYKCFLENNLKLVHPFIFKGSKLFSYDSDQFFYEQPLKSAKEP